MNRSKHIARCYKLGRALGRLAAGGLVCLALATPAVARAGVVFGLTSGTLAGGSRWDAAPRTIMLSGTPFERSLNGGLRYSLQGGSYQAFRDLFSWSGSAPSATAFQSAVEAAFAAWTAPDPATGLTTALSFVADFSTQVIGIGGGGSADSRGAEIDLFGTTDASFWNPGNNVTQGETWFNAVGASGQMTLTSGTTGYGGFAISGADIMLNSNPGALYTLDYFRRLLTHEIGHALGLGDVEGDISPGRFIDDNYDGTSNATAVATLNNSWAALVDTSNPALSPLGFYTVPYAAPGTLTSGVNLLMESRGLGISTANPLSNLVPLTNDEYGIRQFLYPALPPGQLVGDANGDCVVGAADYAIWAAQFGQSGPGLSADFDHNGSVGAGDYAVWAASFGNTCPPSGAAAVPEPSAGQLALVCLLVGAVAGWRRRG